MKVVLEQLFAHEALSREAAAAAMLHITSGEANPAQIAAFAAVYQMRRLTLPELLGFRDALLELATPFAPHQTHTIDIVGTGGDGKNTFNISTLAAVVVAGAGYPVTKHGSYGVSSAVGSSDVLSALGYVFTHDTDRLSRQLERSGLCFLHAPLFHPALKAVAPVRKDLGMRTFFNILGPLVNPVQPTYQLLGTYNLELSRLYHYAMQETGRQYAIIYSLDGYDELSLTGPAKLRTAHTERLVEPADLGLPTLDAADLYGGDSPEAAKTIFLNVLNQTATPAQTAAVLANAGLAIHVIKPTQSLPDCVAEARDSLVSGRARQCLESLLTHQ